ncbi:ATP-binding protein [Spirillospora sp. NPDC047418]
MTTTGTGTAPPDPTRTTTREHHHPDRTAEGASDTGPDGAVTGPDGAAAAWDLPAEARAASRARDLTARTLRGWHVTDPASGGDIADVVLMVDELVTNAVVHGAGPVRLALRLDGTLLTAEVSDAHPAAPAVPGGPPRVLDWAEAGRGLLLVAALATDFGARPRPPGKTVWFTRHLTPTPAAPGAEPGADAGAADPSAADAGAEGGGEPGAEPVDVDEGGGVRGGEGRADSDTADSGGAVSAPRRPEPGRAPAR